MSFIDLFDDGLRQSPAFIEIEWGEGPVERFAHRLVFVSRKRVDRMPPLGLFDMANSFAQILQIDGGEFLNEKPDVGEVPPPCSFPDP